MKKRLLLPGIAALTVLFPCFVTPPAPTPGPGRVIEAVRDFLRAMDERDGDALLRALAERAPGGQFGFEAGGSKIRAIEGTGLAFYDVDVTGQPLATSDRAEFERMIVGQISTKVPMTTEISSVHADCPSGDLSFVIVEFERVHPGHDAPVATPMRATALLRHTSDGLQIFHWHASRSDT